ncbi:hypothetical protein [Tautonia sociabilis]|uniref:Secreted protein n=1 Tax=Tautonia sociabilis TaxID=2080755 RepID=A0A432MQY2_9BACT|nr:hypothetical protein [Tautonia sociabilis]RUL89669.1 hypothetical protein TsocGM_00415 [Tautonia sociabilis]
MSRLVSIALLLAVSIGLSSLPGCGGGGDDGEVQISPEAEAADDAGQKAMEEYMKSGGPQR